MKRKRRTHKPEFKAKVALTAIQGDLTMAELVKKFDVHPNQISEWKKQLLGGALSPFVKVVVVPTYAAASKSPHSFSGFSQTLSGRFQSLMP